MSTEAEQATLLKQELATIQVGGIVEEIQEVFYIHTHPLKLI